MRLERKHIFALFSTELALLLNLPVSLKANRPRSFKFMWVFLLAGQ